MLDRPTKISAATIKHWMQLPLGNNTAVSIDELQGQTRSTWGLECEAFEGHLQFNGRTGTKSKYFGILSKLKIGLRIEKNNT